MLFRFVENSCGCSGSSQAFFHASIQDAGASWILLLCGSLEERVGKTGRWNYQQCSRAALIISEVHKPGEVDKGKGIPHPPHATIKTRWIFMDRDHIAQMDEDVLFHCYLPIKKGYCAFDWNAALPLLVQLMGGMSCAFITHSQTFVGCFEGKWVCG